MPLSEQAVYGTADADENTSMIGTGAGAGTGTKVTVAPMLAVMGLEMFTVLLTTAFEIESPELPPVAVLLMLLVLSLMAELPLVLVLALPLVLPFTLVFVTGLTLHTTAPAVEFVPTPQGPQIVAPTTDEDVPAAQGVQYAEPAVEYVPGTHWVQYELAGAPRMAEYVPAVHAVHVAAEVAPGVDEYVPGAQAVQVVNDEAPTSAE